MGRLTAGVGTVLIIKQLTGSAGRPRLPLPFTLAALIGQVVGRGAGGVYLKGTIGGTRILDLLSGEQLPRIC